MNWFNASMRNHSINISSIYYFNQNHQYFGMIMLYIFGYLNEITHWIIRYYYKNHEHSFELIIILMKSIHDLIEMLGYSLKLFIQLLYYFDENFYYSLICFIILMIYHSIFIELFQRISLNYFIINSNNLLFLILFIEFSYWFDDNHNYFDYHTRQSLNRLMFILGI